MERNIKWRLQREITKLQIMHRKIRLVEHANKQIHETY